MCDATRTGTRLCVISACLNSARTGSPAMHKQHKVYEPPPEPHPRHAHLRSQSLPPTLPLLLQWLRGPTAHPTAAARPPSQTAASPVCSCVEEGNKWVDGGVGTSIGVC